MRQIYREWEDAARRADTAEQILRDLTRTGHVVTTDQLAQLALLEDAAVLKLHALKAAGA